MLTAYLNQTAVYAPLTGHTNRGEPIYGDATTIACRREMKTQEIITSDKRIVKAEWVYYTTQAVKEGDLLDGRGVALFEPMIWPLSGATMGYRAVT